MFTQKIDREKSITDLHTQRHTKAVSYVIFGVPEVSRLPVVNTIILYTCEGYKEFSREFKFKLMYALYRIFLIGNTYIHLALMGLKFDNLDVI